VARQALAKVNEVEAELEALRPRIDALEAEIDALEDILDTLEERDDRTPGGGDHRDEAVLAALEPDEAVTVDRFHTLYKRHTDLKRSDTIRDRVETLVTGPDFERCGSRVWAYRPEGGSR
jgi:predicted nuclease with TOPRIM domain